MKFSIRDLLLVTVIVALAVGWGVDHYRASNIFFRQLEAKHRRLENHARRMESLLNQYGWEVKQADDFKNGWTTRFKRPGDDVRTSSAPAATPPED